MTINKNTPFYLLALVLFAVLKWWFKSADNDQLLFLLQPTNTIVEIVLGSVSSYSPEQGFFHPQLNIVINKSCSGFNFWLICSIMFQFTIIPYLRSRITQFFLLPGIYVLTYFLTLFTNISRIISSIAVESQFVTPSLKTHQIQGMFFHLTFLILFYLMLRFVLHKNTIHHEKSA